VLYEMLTGRREFPGETSASVISAIMTAQPPSISTLVPVTPPALEHLVTRCLAKNPDQRWQTARDVADELRWLQETGGEGGGKDRTRTHAHPRPAWWKIALPAAAVLAIAASAYVLYERSRPVLTDRDVIVLSEFVNKTGDSGFDGTLKTYLATRLEQSPFLSLLPEESVRETLREMRRSPDERVTAEVAREVGQRQGLKAALECAIATFGSRHVITVNAKDCRTGATLFSDAESAEGKEAVPTALDRLASRLRRGLGESLASMQKSPAPVEFRTTSSLEALQAYSRGVEVDLSGGYRESIAYFKRAIELDPSFASAYQRVANRYNALGDLTLAEEYSRKAYALRDRVPEHGNEWYYITSSYHLNVDKDMVREIELAELSN
jgi:tetratricopeptide (TPR) repeat protein